MRGPDKEVKGEGEPPQDQTFKLTVRACLCFQCEFNWGPAEPFKCSAFPKGIPHKYLYGGVRHNRVVKGQKGNFTFKYFHKGA